MKKLLSIIKKESFPILVLIFLVLIVGIINFKPGSWLSGWDNLHPEFNFLSNIKRSIFGAWQEYQGLGLSGGMGYSSDLPRQVLLLISSFIIPVNLLRYLYTFFMLFLGSVGMYFLGRDVVFEGLEENKKKIASFLAGLYYLFNLATVQNFYYPFEPFLTHFGYLPLLLWAFILYLKDTNRKRLLIFILINFFAIPQGYVPTIFLVYLLTLVIIIFFLFLQEKTILFIKKVIRLLLITFAINAFWLLPFIHFTVTNYRTPVEAKTNLMYTEDAVLRNEKSGHISDTVLLRGFWFDNVEPSGTNYQYIMPAWRQHLQDFRPLGYGIFFVIFIGVIYSVFLKRNKLTLGWFMIFLVCFTFIANADPPFVWLNSFLRENIPLFNQVFRFPFMKFSTVLSFSYAIFFAFGCLLVLDLIGKVGSVLIKKLLVLSTMVFIVISVIVFVSPIFRGQLFYYKIQAKIPEEYFQLFSFLKTKNIDSRIANFPQMTYSGWTFYRYNYSGSGFLWYGIEQPILDRAFDVWSSQDENYYWEISYALYSKNLPLFENILEKYNVNWLLVDENIVSLVSPKNTYTEEIYDMISQSSKISFAASFGKVKVFQFNNLVPVKKYVSVAENLPQVGPEYKWNNYDIAHYENGSYFSDTIGTNFNGEVYYPFRSLFTGRQQDDLDFGIEYKNDDITIKEKLPSNLNDYSLIVPKNIQNELIWLDPNDFSKTKSYDPEVNVENGYLTVKYPFVGGYYGIKLDPYSDPYVQNAKNCNNFANGLVKNEAVNDNDGKYLRLTARDAVNCSVSFWLPQLPHNVGYLLIAESRNVSGRSLLFWLDNLNLKRSDMETYLNKDKNFVYSYLIQPPMEKDGIGYSLHFENSSIGDPLTINDLRGVLIAPMPFDFLTKLKFVKNNYQQEKVSFSENYTVQHPNQYFYKLEKENWQTGETIILSQSFNTGWSAFEVSTNTPGVLASILGKKIDDHVLVNNWENGWVINDQTSVNKEQPKTIYLIYVPQYLEFIGFILWITLILWLVRSRRTP